MHISKVVAMIRTLEEVLEREVVGREREDDHGGAEDEQLGDDIPGAAPASLG